MCLFTAKRKMDAAAALTLARNAVQAKDWASGRRACTEALQLAAQAGATNTLSELEGLEKMVWAGEAQSHYQQEGAKLVQRAKASVEGGDFAGARRTLAEATCAFKNAGWEEGNQEIQMIEAQIARGERHASRRKEGEIYLMMGQV